MKYYETVCAEIFNQHHAAEAYKSGIGRKGLYEQIKQNHRFYSGDQWYGAKTGADRPLVRHNIIKRIGEYKTAVIGTDDVKIRFSPVGVASANSKKSLKALKNDIVSGKTKQFGKLNDSEILLASSALSDYFKTVQKRIHFDDICASALKNAFISGTGIVYAYWDCDVKTGLFADDKRTVAITGDINAEVIDIENVDFKDPSLDNVQKQDYIIIAARKSVEQLRREAKRNGVPKYVRENIKADDDYYSVVSGEEKATVLTKFFKTYDDKGNYTIKAIKVCKNAIIKPEWDTGLTLYPIAKFNWDNTSAYGESEITNLIPNQIAINRMLTASVWAVMMLGMPIMLVNGDVITEPVTNEPGQIISFCGSGEDFERSIKYVTPPQFSANFDSITERLIENTLNSVGATDAALGEITSNSTSAILAVKESARLPLTVYKKRYISFIEDIAAIFMDFMLNMYGERPLVQNIGNEKWYFPFDSQRYKNLSFTVDTDIVTNEEISADDIIDELDRLETSEFEQVANHIMLQKQTKEVS